MENIKSNSRISIDFGNEGELPIVRINGKRIWWLSEIHLDWHTRSEKPGSINFKVEHVVEREEEPDEENPMKYELKTISFSKEFESNYSDVEEDEDDN